MPRSSAGAAVACAWCLLACANVAVPASKLPALPPTPDLSKGGLVLILDGLPAAMAEEMLAFAGDAGRTSSPPAPGAALASVCRDASETVLRPIHGRTHFASNVPDRNTFFLYESLVVVGIPVALVSAAVWTYYAETVVSGRLELESCREDAPGPRGYDESFRLRSEGRGFVRTDPLREAQLEGALRGLTRELLEQATHDPGRER